MSHRIIQVIADNQHQKVLDALSEKTEVLDSWKNGSEGIKRVSRSYLVRSDQSQSVIDALQSTLGHSENARVLVLPVEASLPKEEEETEAPNHQTKTARQLGISREELYDDVVRGVEMNVNFILFVFFSTIVATIGVLEDNVAVVIGAMVIAPLLGPNLALALSTALGDIPLMMKAIRTNLTGITITLGLAFLAGLLLPVDYQSRELMDRTQVGFDSIALAMASGAAAVLSLTTGISSVLVGVMVAVALLPPASVLGIMLGAGQWNLALGAGLLLAVNVVCVNLSAKLVFLWKGIRPRTWYEKKKAKSAMLWYLSFWGATLLGLGLLIYFFQGYFSFTGKEFPSSP